MAYKVNVKNISDAMEPTLESLPGILNGLQNLQKAFNSWKQSHRFYHMIEQDTKEIIPALTQAGWWFPPSMSLQMLYKLREAISQRKVTLKELNQLFIDYYEENDWEQLQSMIAAWKDAPHFMERAHIIHDALEAHMNCRYTLVIPTLLPQIEGVVCSILDTSAGKKQVANMENLIHSDDLETLDNISEDLLLSFIHDTAGYARIDSHYFSPKSFSQWFKAENKIRTQFMNRHAILHGIQLNYDNKENSLRSFLLLDMLYTISTVSKNEPD